MVFSQLANWAATKPPPTCGGRDGGGSLPAPFRTYAVFISDRGRIDPQLSEDQRARVPQSFSSVLIACHFAQAAERRLMLHSIYFLTARVKECLICAECQKAKKTVDVLCSISLIIDFSHLYVAKNGARKLTVHSVWKQTAALGVSERRKLSNKQIY